MKHVHRPNTTLRDVVRITGDADERQTSHYLMLQDDLMIVNKNLVYVPRNPPRHINKSGPKIKMIQTQFQLNDAFHGKEEKRAHLGSE
jgi:hypothetical protein